jgi:hypothetical protein
MGELAGRGVNAETVRPGSGRDATASVSGRGGVASPHRLDVVHDGVAAERADEIRTASQRGGRGLGRRTA